MEQFDENVSVDTTQKPTNIGDTAHSVGSNRKPATTK